MRNQKASSLSYLSINYATDLLVQVAVLPTLRRRERWKGSMIEEQEWRMDDQSEYQSRSIVW
jgi:hypothetical protein